MSLITLGMIHQCISRSILHVRNLMRHMQARAGSSIRFVRRGWDFGMPNVIKWLHENEEFRQAPDAAHPLDFTDKEGLMGNPYMILLDRACNHCFSARQKASDAGLYVLGMLL